MYSRIGRRNPLYSTAIGKVLLAWRDESEVRDILADVEFKKFTAKTLESVDQLLPVLDQVRQQGYAEDNQEMEEGLLCVAVPVFDRFGQVTAGLSLSFPMMRYDEKQHADYVAMLHRAARAVSSQMGYAEYPF
jgi:IclR family KDG regulon transcriptional repressor